jgi:hypothetical protein
MGLLQQSPEKENLCIAQIAPQIIPPNKSFVVRAE